MSMPKAEFRKLQQEWYQKLADSGFDDIEEIKCREMVLKETPLDYLTKKVHPDQICLNREYFSIIGQFTRDPETVFKRAVDHFILQMRSDGANLNEITRALAKQGTKMRRNRDTVRTIIRKYEMRWNIRFYTREQLYLHKKKEKCPTLIRS